MRGGLYNRSVDVNRISQKSDPTNPRCIVKIYDKYLSLIPRQGRFYRKPLPHCSFGGRPRFSTQSICINMLQSKMKELFQNAGIDVNNKVITNHSGKLTCATTLFNAGYDDLVIKSRRGHCSNAVDFYKRLLESMSENVRNTLQPPKPQDYDKRPQLSTKENTKSTVNTVK